MEDKIFIHNDTYNLQFFKNKEGHICGSDRVLSYAMQGEYIVGVFYTNEQAVRFYENNQFKDDLPILYRFNQELWDNKYNPKPIMENEIIKPKQLDVVNLTNLRDTCQEYIDFVSSDNYYADNDFEHYIYEEALKAIFGNDIFKYINKKDK